MLIFVERPWLARPPQLQWKANQGITVGSVAVALVPVQAVAIIKKTGLKTNDENGHTILKHKLALPGLFICIKR